MSKPNLILPHAFEAILDIAYEPDVSMLFTSEEVKFAKELANYRMYKEEDREMFNHLITKYNLKFMGNV